MEKIVFDSGVREYKLGQGILRFNPADPNLYLRFMDAGEKMRDLQNGLISESDSSGVSAVKLLEKADRQMKELLNWVFGEENDFHALLGGVNLLAVGSNGQRVIENLLDVLQPVLLEGAKACAQSQTQLAVEKAKTRREAQ